MWHLQHPEGPREINELHVPVGVPVKLTMTSQDVIHGFYIPAFRVKKDVLPGRYTSLWFEATEAGTYHLFCTEFCGTNHTEMIGWVYVMSPADYAAWLASGEKKRTHGAAGRAAFQSLHLRLLPRGGRHRTRAVAGRDFRQAGKAGQRRDAHGGRRPDPPGAPAAEFRAGAGLRADYADIQGTVHRRSDIAADCLCEVARPARKGERK